MENNGNPETQAPMAPNAAEGGMPAPTTIETATAPLPEVPVTTAEVPTADPAPVETAPKHKTLLDMITGLFGGRKAATSLAPTSPVVTTESAPADANPMAPTQETAPAPFAPATPTTELPKAA